MSLSSGGILVISGVIGLGIHASTHLQVGGYSLGYSAMDAIQTRIPSWLIEKSDMDVSQPLLTYGPFVEAIIDETFKERTNEEQVAPYLALVNELGSFREYLITQKTLLEAAATIAWSGLLEETWVKAKCKWLESEIELAHRYSRESYYRDMYRGWLWDWDSSFEPWIQGNKTLLTNLQTNITRLREGVLDAVLWAWGEETAPMEAVVRSLQADSDRVFRINITYSDDILLLGDVYNTYRERTASLERAVYDATWSLPSVLVNYTLFQLQRTHTIEPLLRPLERAIQIETSRANYRKYKTQRDDQNLVVGQILGAFEHFKQECLNAQASQIGCAHIAYIEKHLVGLFTRLRAWDYAIPETSFELILRSGGGEPWAQTISRRDLERAFAIEKFRRSPSTYPTMILVGVLLGFTAFWMSFLYSLFTILNMGLLGTACNLLGVAYEWSGGLRDRAQISRQRLKLETQQGLLLEQGD